MVKREYMASWVCVSGFIRSRLSVSVFRSSACVVSQVMKRPLSEGVIETYASVGCWVCFVLIVSFVDGL